jgi:putative FmdB family regulatory protein
MPVCEFECPACGRFQDLLTTAASQAECPKCGAASKRLVSRFFGGLAPHASIEGEEGRSRHREWLNSPETKQKLDSGELLLETDTRFMRSAPPLVDKDDVQMFHDIMATPDP